MPVHKRRACPFIPAALLVFGWAMSAWSQSFTQSVSLRPGWNSVFLEVTPERDGCEEVFKDLPIESVWAWNPTTSPVQFVQDPQELVPEQPDWLVYFPASSSRAFLTNLHAVAGGKPYLIKLSGKKAATLQMTGEPSLREPEWIADSFNLVGFPLDPEKPPTFKAFFTPSSAHANQPVYRMNDTGEWEEVQSTAEATMRRGEAYWVYSKGPSDYKGPLVLELEQNTGLVYGLGLDEQTLRVRNVSGTAVTVTLRPVPGTGSAGQVPLSCFRSAPGTDQHGWTPLTDAQTVEVKAYGSTDVRLSVLRAAMTPAKEGSAEENALYGSLLNVGSGAGLLYHVPVTAQKQSKSFAGLYVGTVVVDEVGQVNAGGAMGATAAPFQFRVILHVDNTGVVRLLQEVVVTETGLYQTANSVVTGDAQRISAPAFGFQTPVVRRTGLFNGTVLFDIIMDWTSPVHPFKHPYHPEHTYPPAVNLPPGETVPAADATFQIKRTVKFVFSTAPNPDEPGWGATVFGGTYEEAFYGLHKWPLTQKSLLVRGDFQLRKVSNIGVLNAAL